MSEHWPIVLIEGILVFGGALAFGWWQLRSIKRDQQLTAQKRAAEQRAAQAGSAEPAPSSNKADSDTPVGPH
jgi:hypothetical protein